MKFLPFTIFVLRLIGSTLSTNSDSGIGSLVTKQSEILQLIEAWKNQCHSLGTKLFEAISTIETNLDSVKAAFETSKTSTCKWYFFWLDEMKVSANLSSADQKECINKNSHLFFDVYNNLDNTLNVCLENKTGSVLEQLRILISKVDEAKVKFQQYEIFIKNCLTYAEQLSNPNESEQCLDKEAAKAKSHGDELEVQLSRNVDEVIASQPRHQELKNCLTSSDGTLFEVMLITAAGNAIIETRQCIEAQSNRND